MSPKKSEGLSDDELAAMKEYLQEKKAAAKRAASADKAQADEADVLAKISEMSEPDRSMAARIHEIVKQHAPALLPKTWYGMPAYAREGKAVVFFQSADKFKARYATLGFNDSARLDDGALWPVAYALKELTPAVEAQIIALVKKAAG